MNQIDLAARVRAALRHHERQRLEVVDAVPAAVLVPLFLDGDTVHVLYTKRTETVPHHQGQIAFPGGQVDPDDPSAIVAATREAYEEIGLRPEHADVLGALDDIHTLRSNFVITPIVALIPHPYAFTPNPPEVAEIFAVPLPTLRDPVSRREELWEFESVRVPVPTIQYRGHVIWGATERISRNLVDVLHGAIPHGETRIG
jgi:8-oxo-dGTP pyrophosphatase MutT (NUDIX family)